MEGCTDGVLFYDLGPSLSITVAPNFPVESGPKVALSANLVFRGTLRHGTLVFLPATSPSEVSYPLGMRHLVGQLEKHLTYLLEKVPGTRRPLM